MVTDDIRTPADFRLDGLRCPPRVARMVSALLLPVLREQLKRDGAVDGELAVWLRAADEVGGEWATTYARVSRSADVPQTPSQSTHHEQLTTAEIAEEIGTDAHNVRYHVRAGHLAPSRRQPHMLFDRAEVERFKLERRKSA